METSRAPWAHSTHCEITVNNTWYPFASAPPLRGGKRDHGTRANTCTMTVRQLRTQGDTYRVFLSLRKHCASCLTYRAPMHVNSRAPLVRSLHTGRRLPPRGHRFHLMGHGLPRIADRFSLMGHGLALRGHRFSFMARGLGLRGHRFSFMARGLPLRVHRFPIMGYGLPLSGNGLPLREHRSPVRSNHLVACDCR